MARSELTEARRKFSAAAANYTASRDATAKLLAEVKETAVVLVQAGGSRGEVADELGVSLTTVSRTFGVPPFHNVAQRDDDGRVKK